MRKLLLLSFVILQTFLNAQQSSGGTIEDAMNTYEVKLDSIDKKYIKTKYLLNKGFMFSGVLGDYFEYSEYGEDAFIVIDRKKFKRIYKGLRKSDLKNNRNKRLAKFNFKSLKQEYAQQRNTVPLGIIQIKGEYLDSLQIEDHLDKTVNDLPVNEEYKKHFIFSAGALKKRVYSGNVQFEVVPELFHLQNPKSIKSLKIDFSDGLGFRSVDENSSFNVQYQSIGEKAIAIKFKQRNRTFTCYSTVKVVTLEEEMPNRVLSISGDTNGSMKRSFGKQVQISASRSSSSTSGGTASVFLGCDLVFDQPVIVLEGFDPLNENNANNLRANYTTSGVERIFRSNGHDMVYFNFQDGGADMNRNAGFVEDLIQLVNNEKQGNEDIIVIGESMGGIIARLAIRRMEQDRKTQ